MKPLTKKQKLVLSTIVSYMESNGRSPTQLEVAEVVGASSSSVRDHLAQLQLKGYLVKASSLARGIRVTSFDERLVFSLARCDGLLVDGRPAKVVDKRLIEVFLPNGATMPILLDDVQAFSSGEYTWLVHPADHGRSYELTPLYKSKQGGFE